MRCPRGPMLFGMILCCMPAACFAQSVEADNAAGRTISLAGEWQFRLDPQDQGVAEKWFESTLPQKIKLPGSTDEAGYGKKTEGRIAHWLNRVYEYVGPAWYQKEIVIPEDWQGKRIVLFLERCHWETQAWIDGKPAGMQDSLCTPHEYDLSKLLPPGKHRLTIRVDNRIKINVGKDAHSVADHTQTNWNGIIGRIELQASDPIWIEELEVFPVLVRPVMEDRSLSVLITIKRTRWQGPVRLTCEVREVPKAGMNATAKQPPPRTLREEFPPEFREYMHASLSIPMGEDVKLWDEFSPSVYELTARASTKVGHQTMVAEKRVRFGMREFRTKGTQFTINGRLTFLRGTLECCIFPLTGYPPTDVDSWRRIIRVAKAHGLNHFRFHSWCPPEAAFTAADEEGFYFHVETPVWTALGEDPKIDAFIRAEGDRILKEYGNHPSFCMLCVGNEPSGKNQGAFLTKIVSQWKQYDPRRVYTGCSGWPVTPEADYVSRPQPRGHAWGAGLKSRFNAGPLSTNVDYSKEVAAFKVPVVSHEIGQWCAYPNFKEIAKYTGVVRARNFEVFRDSLAAHHMLDQADDFLMASGKWQALLYKEEIETALRTPGFGGFQLLDLHDFPGQGTALVGVRDAFWDSKGYITAHEFHKFCCETVPLLRAEKFTWTTAETFKAEVQVAHYGSEPLKNAVPLWTLVDTRGGKQVASGELPAQTIPLGGVSLGKIELPLAKIDAPTKLVLTVSLEDTPYTNHWDVWVYPADVDTKPPKDVLIADKLDKETLAALEAGKKVLLMPPPAAIRSDVPPGFTTIFWNTQWTRRQPPHTLGILCDPECWALDEFPTESHSNWQWWDLVSKSRAMILDDFPADFRPIVQVIDDWNTNRKLGLIFEARVGRGKLLVCSIDLRTRLAERPVARQMLHSLLVYMGYPCFAEAKGIEIDVGLIRGLLREPPPGGRLKVVKVDSQAEGYEGENAVDSDSDTIWHTQWEPTAPGFPHEIQFELEKVVEVKGFRYLPRQDMTHGRVAGYEFYVSEDGKTWGEPAAKGTFKNDAGQQQVLLKTAKKGRYLRLVALSEVKGQRFASMAEFDVITAAP